MTIICICGNECCTCKGCQPQMASDGRWMCPRCKDNYERTLNVGAIAKQNNQVIQSQIASPWRQQIITNHLRKR